MIEVKLMRMIFGVWLALFLFKVPSLAQSVTPKQWAPSDWGLELEDFDRDQVRFWRRVFVDFSTKEAILHDSRNLRVIYRVIPFLPKLVEEEKTHIRDVLLSMAKKLEQGGNAVGRFDDEEFKFFELFQSSEDPAVYRVAADPRQIRVQVGQKDRLKDAFSISKLYLNRMESMFHEEGVPKELTRIPFVESGFIHNAQSSMGALGIWQIMLSTAQRDLKVRPWVDERRDPLKSTRAAAKFFQWNYQRLKSWPLSIMAYHHGLGLVNAATKQVGSRNPFQIVRKFVHPQFQFASRNYLYEFLAILEVDRLHESFFSDLQNRTLPAFITVSFPSAQSVPMVVQKLKLNADDIRILNPHLLDPIWSGSSKLPPHYPIRLSGIALEDFRKAFK